MLVYLTISGITFMAGVWITLARKKKAGSNSAFKDLPDDAINKMK